MNPIYKVLSRAAALLFFAAVVCVSLDLVYRHTIASPHLLDWSVYGFSDLLINYDAGFVRRGLIGALVRRYAAPGSYLSALNSVLFANFVLLAALLTGLSVVSRKRSVFVTLLVFLLPGSLFAMALSGQFFFRKEMFFYSALCLCALLLALAQQLRPAALRRVAAALCILLLVVFGIIAPFVHESFLFLSAPASAFLLFAAVRAMQGDAAASTDKPAKTLAAIYLGFELVLFLVLSHFKGNQQVAQTIWNNLPAADRGMILSNGEMVGGIASLALTLKQGVMVSVRVLLSGLAWYWLVPIAGAMLFCLALASLYTGRPGKKESSLYPWTLCYLALGICTLPIFLLGCDWGRWLVSTNLSFIILWLAIQPENLAVLALPQRLSSTAAAIAKAATAFESFVLRHRRAVLAVLFLFALTFRIPEGCLGGACGGDWAVTMMLYTLKSVIHTHHLTVIPCPILCTSG